MPISHSLRSVFIHIPKTAGTSLLDAVQRSAGPWEFNGINAWPRFFAHPNGARLFHQLRQIVSLGAIAQFREQHLPARILRQLVSDEVWSSYFKFTFVRNPWDLVVSTYSYMRIMLREHAETMVGEADLSFIFCSVDFENYVRARPYFGAEPGILPYITDENGELLVDFVGKVEQLEFDAAVIAKRLGIELPPLPRHNQVIRGGYQEYYTTFTRDLVAREFAREIEMFGYEF